MGGAVLWRRLRRYTQGSNVLAVHLEGWSGVRVLGIGVGAPSRMPPPALSSASGCLGIRLLWTHGSGARAFRWASVGGPLTDSYVRMWCLGLSGGSGPLAALVPLAKFVC
jgi:hypothetical protein